MIKHSILKIDLRSHQVVHSNNKQFKCNECSYQINRRQNLNDHIQIRYTRQDIVRCMWPECGTEMVKRRLK